MTEPAPVVRLTDVLGTFAFAGDLAFGLPLDDGIRSCLMALRIAERLGLSEEERRDVYYAALMKDAGCTCWTSPLAAFWQTDEIVARRELLIFGDPNSARFFLSWMLKYVASNQPVHARLRHFSRVFLRSNAVMEEGFRTACDVTVRLASRMGMPPAVQTGLRSLFEQWNGKGLPAGLRGSAIPIVARIVLPTFYLAPCYRRGGREAAIQVALRGRGKAFDPAVADAFLALAEDDAFWAELATDPIWPHVRALEPGGPPAILDGEGLDAMAEAVADFTDLKSPHTAAHSRRVAGLARRLTLRMGAPEEDARALYRAALMHDVGMVAVPSFALARAGHELSTGEREAIRLHPYYSERILGQVAELRPLTDAIAAHHERLDGSGFFRGLSAGAIPAWARLIAVADRFDLLTHDSPGRGGLPASAALAQIRAEPAAYAPDAVQALEAELGEAKPTPRRQASLPAGLTEREVEVLRAAARGLTRKQIAQALTLSEHTVRHHLEHVYGKTGTQTRVGAVLFAMEHELLP